MSSDSDSYTDSDSECLEAITMSSESESYSDSDSDSDSVSSEAIEIPLRFPQFPEPIIVEILSRLPVKSLLKFKFVSKSWHSLISSKYFIKTHLENSVKNPTLSRYRCISTIRKSYWKLEHHYLPSFRPRKDIYSSDLDREDDKQKALDLVGSCNGLICFLVGKECSGWWKPVTTVSKPCFVLWNPATKESKILPDFHGGRKNPIQVCIIKCGFGFDEKSDDYKVFAVMSVTKPKMIGATHHETVAKVYSLKSDSWTQIELLEDDTPVDVAGKFASWTRIELLEDDTPVDVAGKFASGKLHWIRNSSRNSRWDIVSFDLTTEASRHVDQPGYVEPGFYPTLGVLDGSLCVLCDYCKTQLDVWIWNEYGNQDSWTKMVSISYLTDPVEGKLSNALCVLPNHEVLFLLDSGFISYNPKRSWIYHPQNLVDSEELIDAEVYVQSLVPLVSENAIKSPVEDGTSTSKKGNSPVKKGTSKKGKAPVKDGTSKKGKPRKNRRSNKK